MAFSSLPAPLVLAAFSLLLGADAAGPSDALVTPLSSAVAPRPATGGMASQPRKTWTAADLQRLSKSGVSVTGGSATASNSAASQLHETADDAVLLAVTPSTIIDWSGQAAALNEALSAATGRVATLDELIDEWGAYAVATPQYRAAAAQELGDLTEARAATEAALARARAELAALEESARKAGVPPGQLR